MKRVFAAAAVLLIAATSVAQAQEKASAANASATGMTALLGMVKGNILKAAEQVPEEKYSYQPTKEVRTLGALLAHIADAQTFFCSQLTASPKDYSDATEKGAKTKAEIVAALTKSFEACDAAYGAVTDANLSKPLTIFGNKTNVAGAMTFNTAHDWEHYGNIVTYMRMLGMVPPSSQR